MVFIACLLLLTEPLIARSSTSHETFAIIEPLLYAGRPVNVSNPPWTCLTCNLAVVNIVHILIRLAHWWRDIRITHLDIHDTAVIRRIRITSIHTRIDHRIVRRIVRRICFDTCLVTVTRRVIDICLATRRVIAKNALRVRYRGEENADQRNNNCV